MTNITLNHCTFSYEEETLLVNGNLSLAGKNIQNINGSVLSDGTNLGTFDAYRNGNELAFNLRPVKISDASALATAVAAAVEAVESELGKD